MIFLLLFIVFSILIYTYLIHAKYIMHPTIVVGLVTLLGVMVAAANYTAWGDIDKQTCMVIAAGVLAFTVGGIISTMVNRRYCLTIRGKRLLNNSEEFKNGIVISNNKTIIVVIFMLIVTILYLLEMRQYAGSSSLFFLSIFSAARSVVYSGKAISISSVLQQGIYICKALTYVYVFYIIYQNKVERKKVKLIYYAPLVLYMIQIILSTARSEIIYFVYAILVIYYCLSMKMKGWQQKNDYSFFTKMIKAFIVFMLIFVVLGNIRNNVNSSLFDTFSRYIGSPIYALNDYIQKNGISECSSFWGEETQYLYYSVLRKMGLSDKVTDVTLLPTYIGKDESVRTNIYMSFRRYLHDYGMGGMIVICSGLGYIYTSFFEKIKKNDNKYLLMILFAYLSYPLAEMAIEERFFTNLLTARTVMCCIYMIIVFKVLIKDKIVLDSEKTCGSEG
ncbi:MAG: oligosaccharide repeat unit polymerase [Roseburia sp.]|nr:oligosaccharide repeat unit polymerase [Roseburia sp.]